MAFLKENGIKLPDEKYYQLLIAKAILFKQTENIVSQQKFGGYRANIVTYTIALLSHKSAQRIDLKRIWEEHQLTVNLEKEIALMSIHVQKHIVNPPNGANIGEYCKKKSCWDSLIKKDYSISKECQEEFIPLVGDSPNTPSEPRIDDEDAELIDKIASIRGEVWLSISNWAKETNNLMPWQRGIAFSVGTAIKRGRKPSIKQARQALILYNAAIEKGFDKEL
jgi:hypothetical protein